MSESGQTSPDSATQSAGALLRAAREKQGLHIAALAAAIKVSPAKLDALERDRFDELPDATFVRALAQSVCRVLKVDAAPILQRLPAAPGAALEKVDAGLNTPFRDRPGRIDPTEWTLWRLPAFWIVAALLAGALAIWLLPPLKLPASQVASQVAASAPGLVDAAASAVAAALPQSAAASATDSAAAPVAGGASAATAVPTATAATAVAAAASAKVETLYGSPSSEAASAAGAYLLVLRADEASWVEVQDARGQVLFSRTLVPGENVGIDGAVPLRARIGNVAATRLVFRGQPVDLATVARDNVARVELK